MLRNLPLLGRFSISCRNNLYRTIQSLSSLAQYTSTQVSPKRTCPRLKTESRRKKALFANNLCHSNAATSIVPHSVNEDVSDDDDDDVGDRSRSECSTSFSAAAATVRLCHSQQSSWGWEETHKMAKQLKYGIRFGVVAAVDSSELGSSNRK